MRRILFLLVISALTAAMAGQGGITGSGTVSLTGLPPILLYGLPVQLTVNVNLTGITAPATVGLGGFVVPAGFDSTKYLFQTATFENPYNGASGVVAFTDPAVANSSGFVAVVGATSDSTVAAPTTVPVGKIVGQLIGLGAFTMDLTSPVSAPAQSALSLSSKWTSGGGPAPIAATGTDSALGVFGKLVLPGAFVNNFGNLNGGDFDGDGKSDYVVFNPNTALWSLNCSTAGASTVTFGAQGDIPVPGDYDGDGITDRAVFRPSTNIWILECSTLGRQYVGFGTAGDIPVPEDYDGDGRVDVAVFRPTASTWLVRRSTLGVTNIGWGTVGDIPVPSDYDGDGITDLAVFRPSWGTWLIRGSSAGRLQIGWGLATDIPIPMDYGTDGITDIAVFRPSFGGWYIRNTQLPPPYRVLVGWGLSTDIPVTGYYDADNLIDVAVFRPSTSSYLVRRSTDSGKTTVAIGAMPAIAVSR